MSVYTLKHATPRMKYAHMNHMMAWKEQIRDAQEAEIKRQRHEELLQYERDLMETCYELEGETFVEWYDDSGEVPVYGNTRDRVRMVETRLTKLLKGAQ